MGNNSQSNIMKKLLLLGIITLTALFIACEKDKPEDNSNSSTYGIDISTLDINDPNLYFWTYTYSLHCVDAHSLTTCIPGTNKYIIEELIPIFKDEEAAIKEQGCNLKLSISKISYEEYKECEEIYQPLK